MAGGHERNRARRALLASFGKDLARRSRSRCELCEAAGVSLEIVELRPVPAEPDFERCLLACAECASGLVDPARGNRQRWRALSNAVWSEVPAVQIGAVRVLRRIADDEDWARELLDQLYLDPDIEALIEEKGWLD